MEEKRAGNSDQITRNYLDSLLLEMRHLDGQKPDTTSWWHRATKSMNGK